MARTATATLAALALGTFLALPSSGQGGDSPSGHRIIGLPGAGLDLPFSGGVVAGDLLYLSGALGNQPGEMTISGSPAAQTRQTLANLETVLKEAGLDKSRIVATTVYVSDLRLYPTIGRTLSELLSDDRSIKIEPTRTVVEADIALPGAVVEIAAVAALPGVEVAALSPENWPATSTGYSWGVRAGDTVFVGGQSGVEIASRRLAQDIGGQTRQAIANIGAVLESGGLGLEHLVACRVYLPDARSFGGMNEAWRAALAEVTPPTRATTRARLPRSDLEMALQCIAERGKKKVVSLPGEDISRLPFSPALAVDDRLYLSGFVGRGPDGYPPDLGAQTTRVIDRLEAHLKQAGMAFEDVVSAEVWVDDIRHYQPMNEIYRRRIPSPPPARATVASRLMSPDARVEIAMIAVSRGQ